MSARNSTKGTRLFTEKLSWRDCVRIAYSNGIVVLVYPVVLPHMVKRSVKMSEYLPRD